MPEKSFELEPDLVGPTRAVPLCVSAHPQTGLACHQRGVPPAGFSHPTSSRTGRCVGSATPLKGRLPMIFAVERPVNIGRGIEVSLCFILADRAPEQFASTSRDPLTCAQGEPLPMRAATSAILTGAMWIDLHRDRFLRIDLFTGEPIDLSPQLVRLLAIEPSGLAYSPRLDLAQPFEEQHTAWVLRTYPRNGMCGLAGGIGIHATHMPPELPITLLSFDGLA